MVPRLKFHPVVNYSPKKNLLALFPSHPSIVQLPRLSAVSYPVSHPFLFFPKGKRNILIFLKAYQGHITLYTSYANNFHFRVLILGFCSVSHLLPNLVFLFNLASINIILVGLPSLYQNKTECN